MARTIRLRTDSHGFGGYLQATESLSAVRMSRAVLYALAILIGVMLAWSAVGSLDIVAIAQGKLVPESFVKIVQPSDSGVIKQIKVREGDAVEEGQVLIQMDTRLAEADLRILENELQIRDLQTRRIDAELGGTTLRRKPNENPGLFAQIEAQFRARRQAYIDSLDGERAVLKKNEADLKAATEIESKLKRTAPIYREQAEGWRKLAKEGFAGRLLALDRQRNYIEAEQDLRAQVHTVESLRALIKQSEKRIAQITSNYRQQLQNQRVENNKEYDKLQQEFQKQTHRHALLELRAPQAGIVKDLATHTIGTVVAPGTVLLTLVPHDEPLLAEVWVSNMDAGFLRPNQPVKVKLAAFPFQQYGTLDGTVRHVSADATDSKDITACKLNAADEPLKYRALVALKTTYLERGGRKLKPAPGMQVNAEIVLGTRTVMEYLLSPIQKVANEAGREL